MADQEVVDWISHEYLTPRRGSTSSEGGVTLPLSHSLPSTAHHTHSLSHSHSFLHPHPHSMRSNSMSGVTLRSGSHPSLDALPSTSELGRGGRLVRAANLIRIIKRLSTSTKLRRKHRLEEVKEMGPAMECNAQPTWERIATTRLSDTLLEHAGCVFRAYLDELLSFIPTSSARVSASASVTS